MAGFGVRFKAANRAQLRARSTPLSGASPEAVWWEFYDTQTYVAAGVGVLNFFVNTNADRTLSNMQAAGQFPDPQWLTIYDITLDILTQPTRIAAAAPAVTGQLNDHSIILKGPARGTWELEISDKKYGPFSLSLLHGTGGPVGNIFSSADAAAAVTSWATNTLAPGWNYNGTLIIPPKTNFTYVLRFNSTAVSVDNPLRLAQHGILSRRVL